MAADAGKKMVVGFNQNVKHRGQTYHVQTEDSGLENPHVVTHLFLGGNVVATRKTSYAALVGAGDLPTAVRALMEEQHKEVLRNLVDGVYDEGAAARPQSFQPGQIEADGRTVRLQPAISIPAPREARLSPAPAARPAQVPAPAPATRPPAPAQRPVPAPRAADAPFGDELIAERSLDEVILSYLAEDLGGRK